MLVLDTNVISEALTRLIGFAAFAEGPCTRLDNDLARLSGLQITVR